VRFCQCCRGVVLIGVDEKNEIKGVIIDNSKRSAIQNSIGEITPAIHCTLTMVEVDGKSVGVIEVPSGANKPYVLSGAIYVRIGPNSQKLTTAEQMRDFFQQSGKIYFDEGGCKEFDPTKDLDLELLSDFKSAARLNENTPDNQIFRNLKLLNEDNFFKNGAVLFFGKQPEQIFEKAIVRCIAFKGKDKRFIVDDKSFGGTLHSQYTKTIQWLKEKNKYKLRH
jgi:ATP-dependent DNA helicase RecG